MGVTVSLKARAIAALARREHSRSELTRKLAPHAQSEDALEDLLSQLEEKNLLSNQRFAESLSHQREKKYGSVRIVAELAQHGLSDDLIREHKQRLRSTELERAFLAWQKRFGRPPGSDKEKAQQLRFLLARGFPSQVFYQLVSQGFVLHPHA